MPDLGSSGPRPKKLDRTKPDSMEPRSARPDLAGAVKSFVYAALGHTKSNGPFEVKIEILKAINEQPELFYFSKEVEKYVDDYNLQYTIESEGCIRASLEEYISILVNINPKVIIDDIIVDGIRLLRKQGERRGLEPFYTVSGNECNALKWLECLVACKPIRKPILRLAFENILYSDGFPLAIRSDALELIIIRYYQIDSLARKSEIDAIGEVHLLKQSREKEEENLGLSRGVSDRLKQLLNAHFIFDTASLMELNLLAKSRKECLLQLEKYLISNTAVQNDNVFVLASIAWEEFEFYFFDANSSDYKSLCRLIALLIRVTGSFLKLRLEKNITGLKKISMEECAIATAILENKELLMSLVPVALEISSDCKGCPNCDNKLNKVN